MYFFHIIVKDLSSIWIRKQKTQLVLFTIVFLTTYISAQENWVYRYDGAGDNDEANSVVYGSDGNIYAAGYSIGQGTGKDFMVISLTQAGDTNWTYRYNGQGNGDDEATSMVYGSDDNIYIAGYTTGSGTAFDIIVISLTTTGDTNWIYQYNALDNDDIARSIAYGNDNNLYIAGYSEQENPYFCDLLIISLTNTGDVRWGYRNNPRWHNEFYQIIYGSDENIYACGYCLEEAWESSLTVVSLDTTGAENWIYHRFAQFNRGFCVDFGLDGNIYAGGTVKVGAGIMEDFAIVSLTQEGNLNWLFAYPDSVYPDYGVVYSITYGLDNNIYGAGFQQHPFVVSITAAGDTIWTYSEYGSGSVKSIVYGFDGEIYAAGENETDFKVWCFSNAGSTNWVYTYDGPAFYYDGATSIVFGDNNDVYAAGYSTGQGSYKDITVISLQAFCIEESVSNHSGFYHFQCIPNIVKKGKGSTLCYSLDRETQVTLSVYNALGQCVKTLVDNMQRSGQYTVFWDCRNGDGSCLPSGTYFVFLKRGDSICSEKIIVY